VEISEGVVVIGVDEEETPMDNAELAPGGVVPITQTLYLESEEQWRRGDEIGSAYGAFVLTRRGRAVGNLTFSFDGEDGLTAAGQLPFDGRSIGDGVLAVVGGTGGLKSRTGEVHVEVRNPKRYRFAV
jgi:hypothetical protein